MHGKINTYILLKKFSKAVAVRKRLLYATATLLLNQKKAEENKKVFVSMCV